MRTELSQARLDELQDRGASSLAVGCVVDYMGEQWTITAFSGHIEIDDEVEHEFLDVHLSNGKGLVVDLEIETVTRQLCSGDIKPISPDWFVEEWQCVEAWQQNEAVAKQHSEAKAENRKHEKRIIADIRAKAESREMQHWTDAELFAKVTGASLAVAEELLISYEGNLKRMAGSPPKQLQLIGKLTEARSLKVAAAFELGKRLARHHAERPKITAPADIADLMMSKLRYLTQEVAVVLALDTKGNVKATGKAGEIADNLEWGSVLAESDVFQGTLNACMFHPREIFRFAIQESAASVVLLHNHPSGDPQPSQEDIRATKQCIEAGNQIGIKVLDHIIIGDGIFVSLKEENLI